MSRSVIAQLRDFVPIRPLTRAEALRIAEMQAARFRKLMAIDSPILDESAIAELPRIEVHRMGMLPVSGATAWSNGRWVVLLKGTEPGTRQRFSLAHELKHILDHRFIGVLYQGIPQAERAEFVEKVCDYFAGCLLMPRTALKQAWASGLQTPILLAAHFDVSQPAIETRLAQIGQSRPTGRCNVGPADWALPFIDSAGSSSASYQRSLHPAWAGLEGVPA